MAIIHRLGSDPENPSESLAITHLATHLPSHYIIFHNFEILTNNGRGLPYEYDICVVGDYAVYHIEVKNYKSWIGGDVRQWEFENGFTVPSPLPLANKKSKILGGRLKNYRGGGGGSSGGGGGSPSNNYYNNNSHPLDRIWVETFILLTDNHTRIAIRDAQARRKVIHLHDAPGYLQDVSKLSVSTPMMITPYLREEIGNALFGACGGGGGDGKGGGWVAPRRRVKYIGVYNIVDRIHQTDKRTVFLARHRYIRTRPLTILKVFHVDHYVRSETERLLQLEAIFHNSEACRLLGAHPHLVQTSDMFAWEDNGTCFVLPTEYVDCGKPLEILLTQFEESLSSPGGDPHSHLPLPPSPPPHPQSSQSLNITTLPSSNNNNNNNIMCRGTGHSFYRKYSTSSSISSYDDEQQQPDDNTTTTSSSSSPDTITWTTKLHWIIRICRGLIHLHSHGVIHRDLRPLNIVVAPGGITKLVNFDYAKVEGSPLHCEKDEIISHLDRRYAAPEVYSDPWNVDRRCDVFSVGAVLYRLIVGRAPPLRWMVVRSKEGRGLYERMTSGKKWRIGRRRNRWKDWGRGSYIDWDALAGALMELENQQDFRRQVMTKETKEGCCCCCVEDLVGVLDRMLRRRYDERYETVEELMADLKIFDDDHH